MEKPKTLQQAIQYFSDEQVCIDTVAALRWPNDPECPACGHREHYYLKTQKRWKCKECSKQFTVKLGTIFEESPIPLSKWLVALWMLVNCRNGVSSYEVARDLGITQKSAWFVLHRLRMALKSGNLAKMGGGENSEIEVDETYIGGKLGNMHPAKRRRIREAFGTTVGGASKTIVMGFVDREQRKVRATIVPSVSRTILQNEILKHVAHDSNIYTDEAKAYDKLPEQYVHEIVNHAREYVRGRVHTNSLENFWSLLKRGLNGTYVAVEPFHLRRILTSKHFAITTERIRTVRASMTHSVSIWPYRRLQESG
jgi:transposase-like protein